MAERGDVIRISAAGTTWDVELLSVDPMTYRCRDLDGGTWSHAHTGTMQSWERWAATAEVVRRGDPEQRNAGTQDA